MFVIYCNIYHRSSWLLIDTSASDASFELLSKSQMSSMLQLTVYFMNTMKTHFHLLLPHFYYICIAILFRKFSLNKENSRRNLLKGKRLNKLLPVTTNLKALMANTCSLLKLLQLLTLVNKKKSHFIADTLMGLTIEANDFEIMLIRHIP